MSDAPSRRSATAKFSLRHLLTLTALIAVGIAVGLAYRSNRSLTQRRDELLSLSSRLPTDNEDELVSAAMPAVADDFESWHVRVPEGQDYELRLGIGTVSEKGVPPVVGSVRVPSGQHRVTLYTGDSISDRFRYAVYLDGAIVIEKTMGNQWLPNGWSSASGISWPRSSKLSPPPLQLAGQSYEAARDFGNQHYFNGQSDEYVTRLGYRLWIDRAERTYQSAAPFMGFVGEPQYQGIGLRDGIRYKASSPPYQWTFTRPKFATPEPVLRVEAEFVSAEGSVLSGQSQVFKSWQIRNAASGADVLRWQEEPAQTSYTAYLHAVSSPAHSLQPVVEMKWDVSRPDAVGIRLADTPANDQVGRWRLRILDGRHHLWRELRIGERPWITPADALSAGNVPDESSVQPSKRTAVLNLGDVKATDIDLQWQTNETLPLQIVARSDNRYAGVQLYRGLPVRLGIEIPAALKPKVAVDVADQQGTVPGTVLPGGPVFDAIQIELEAAEHDWIWLSAQSKE